MLSGRYARRASRESSSGGDTPGGAVRVRWRWRRRRQQWQQQRQPVRGGDQCLSLCASREPSPPAVSEHVAHPRCAVAITPLCEKRSRSEQGVPDNDWHIGACTRA